MLLLGYAGAADVRDGSLADIHGPQRDVRFTPESGHRAAALQCPLSASSGHSPPQSINVGGTVRPSTFGGLEFGA